MKPEDPRDPGREFKAGDVVFTNHVIIVIHKYPNGEREHYIGSRAGRLAIVMRAEHPRYQIALEEGGIIPVLAEDINPYQGHSTVRER